MWLHAPRSTADAASASFALAHEFELWMLASGKPTLTPSSEIDWPKSRWLHALDLWESHDAQAARVRDHLTATARARGDGRLRSLGLCAGYGGLEAAMAIALALRGAQRTIGYVERQAYAAAVLATRMKEGDLEEAPIWDDLTTFDCIPWRGLVDIVAAGFPCQGASVAGKRLGVDDDRWLWPHVWRITQECGASYLFVENVPGLLSVNGGRAFESILGDLASRGWAAEWDCVPAAAVGAPHLRDRLFLFAADADRVGVRVEPERDQRGGRGERAAEREPALAGGGRAGGSAADADRGAAPRGTERPGRRSRRRHAEHAAEHGGELVADADGERRGSARRGRVHAGEPDPDRRGEVVADADQHGVQAGERGPGDEHAERDQGRASAGERGEDATDANGAPGEPHRRSERAEPRDAEGTGADDPDAARLGRDQGFALDADTHGEGRADAGRSGEHGALADAGRARSQGCGTAEPTADRDRAAGGARDVADADRHGQQGLGHGGQLVEGERTPQRHDADRPGGEAAGHDGGDVGAGRQLAAILEHGRSFWDWGRAPEPTVRGVDDGPTAGVGDDTRSDELHLLGNGVVPQAAAYAFVILWTRLVGSDLDVP